MKLGKGFCDVLLVPKGTNNCLTRYSYLLEIKYMKAGETNVDVRFAEVCDQLDRYVADKHLLDSPLLRGTPLLRGSLLRFIKEMEVAILLYLYSTLIINVH